MYVASTVLMNKLVHIIIINVFTSLCYANLFFTLILKKTLRRWNRHAKTAGGLLSVTVNWRSWSIANLGQVSV